MKVAGILVLVVVAMVHLMVEPSQALTCGQVTTSIAQCVNYLTGKQPSPPPACCAGVRKLQSMAATTADRRTACSCLKAAAAGISNLRADAASSLPNSCRVNLGVPISRNIDCNKIG